MKILIVGFISILTLCSCNKTEIINPDDYNFSCYINGKLFTPVEGASLTSSLPSDNAVNYIVRRNPEALMVTAQGRGAVYFSVLEWTKNKQLILNKSHGLLNGDDPLTVNHAVVLIDNKKYISKDGSGKIIFKKNSIENGVEGTFEFTLYNEKNESDVIKVTKGKFR